MAKVLEFFSLNISPSNEYSGLISFRMDWFDLAVQGTLNSLLQHHSSKASPGDQLLSYSFDSVCSRCLFQFLSSSLFALISPCCKVTYFFGLLCGLNELQYCFCCSVVKSYMTLCYPLNCNIPSFPVFHYLLELAQTHVH